jgi:hypothetical protein
MSKTATKQEPSPNEVAALEARTAIENQIAANIRSRVTSRQDSLSAKFLTASQARSAGGYTEALAAAREFDLTAEMAAVWAPATLRAATLSPIDDAMRQAHDLLEPASGPRVRDDASKTLQMVVNAASVTTATKAKEGNGDTKAIGSIPTRTTGNGKDGSPKGEAEARAALDAYVQEAIDGGMSAIEIDRRKQAQAAVDDVAAIRALGHNLNALRVAGSRWRASLYLPLIDDALMGEFAGSNAKGKLTVGSVWEGLATKVASAITKAVKDRRDASNPVTPDDVRALARDTVRIELGVKLGEAKRVDARTADQISEDNRKAAIAAIYKAVEGLVSHGVIEPEESEEGARTILNALAHLRLKSPAQQAEEEKSARTRKENEERDAKKALAKREADQREREKMAAKAASDAASKSAEAEAQAKVGKPVVELTGEAAKARLAAAAARKPKPAAVAGK